MYTHTSSPYPAPHDTYCRDCQRAISQGELIRRRVLDAGGVAFEEHLLCGEPSSDCTLNQGSINHMQEEFRRDRLDERVAQLDHDRIMALELAHQAREEARKAQELNDKIWWVINSCGAGSYKDHRRMFNAIRTLLESRT